MGETMNTAARNLIPIYENQTPALCTGSVAAAGPEGLRVRLDNGIFPARTAFSCLVRPESGDTVLCALTETSGETTEVYILGILQRPTAQALTLDFPSDVSVRASAGGMTLTARDRISLASRDIASFSQTQVHKSKEAVIDCDKTTITGNDLQAGFKTVHFISTLVTAVARQVLGRFKGYVRHTRDSDMVRSGQMIRRSEGLYAVDSRHTIMKSAQSTKIDGEKILMG